MILPEDSAPYSGASQRRGYGPAASHSAPSCSLCEHQALLPETTEILFQVHSEQLQPKNQEEHAIQNSLMQNGQSVS